MDGCAKLLLLNFGRNRQHDTSTPDQNLLKELKCLIARFCQEFEVECCTQLQSIRYQTYPFDHRERVKGHWKNRERSPLSMKSCCEASPMPSGEVISVGFIHLYSPTRFVTNFRAERRYARQSYQPISSLSHNCSPMTSCICEVTQGNKIKAGSLKENQTNVAFHASIS